MHILTYAQPSISAQWHALLSQAGLVTTCTRYAPPSPPSLQVLTCQAWEALLFEQGLEEQTLALLAEAQPSTEALAPIFILGGVTSPEKTREALRRGATACLGEDEIACLPQMLRQEAKLAYLRRLLHEQAWPSDATADALAAWQIPANIEPSLRQYTHDLNTQILSITLYIELLQERLALDDSVMADLEHVLAAADRASKLVQQVRALYAKNQTTP